MRFRVPLGLNFAAATPPAAVGRLSEDVRAMPPREPSSKPVYVVGDLDEVEHRDVQAAVGAGKRVAAMSPRFNMVSATRIESGD